MPGAATDGPRPAPPDEWPFRYHRTMAEVAAAEAAWIQTYTGRRFRPFDPRPEDVCIKDIAHALAFKCRFGGHCTAFYSVAQHSVLVSEAVASSGFGSAVQLEGLMHDAAEAYLPDVPRPVKPHLLGFANIEIRVERAIASAFDLPWPWCPAVKRTDTAILRDEAIQLMDGDHSDWDLPEPALGIPIDPWGPEEAERRFLERFEMLWEARR